MANAIGAYGQSDVNEIGAFSVSGSGFTGGAAPGAAKRRNLNAALWYKKMAKQREQSLKAQEEYFKKLRS